MPQLKYLFKNAITPDYRMLRGKTMECISLIGLAVGKEKVCICFFIRLNKTFSCFSLSMIVMK
jgi:hypothetical protein